MKQKPLGIQTSHQGHMYLMYSQTQIRFAREYVTYSIVLVILRLNLHHSFQNVRLLGQIS